MSLFCANVSTARPVRRTRTRELAQRSLVSSKVGSIAIAIIVALAALYLLMVNDMNTKVYEIRSLKGQVNAMTGRLADVKREAAQSQSRMELSGRIARHSFEPEGLLEFVSSPSPVALGNSAISQ